MPYPFKFHLIRLTVLTVLMILLAGSVIIFLLEISQVKNWPKETLIESVNFVYKFREYENGYRTIFLTAKIDTILSKDNYMLNSDKDFKMKAYDKIYLIFIPHYKEWFEVERCYANFRCDF